MALNFEKENTIADHGLIFLSLEYSFELLKGANPFFHSSKALALTICEMEDELAEVEKVCNAVDYVEDLLKNTDRGYLQLNIVEDISRLVLGTKTNTFSEKERMISYKGLQKKCPPPVNLEKKLDELIVQFNLSRHKNDTDKMLVAVIKFFIDFLSLHPFKDGNGRTARVIFSYIYKCLYGIHFTFPFAMRLLCFFDDQYVFDRLYCYVKNVK